MAQFDRRNLAPTVYAIPRRRLPCKVGFAIDGYTNGGRTWTWSHQWRATTKRPNGVHQTLRPWCVNCGKTVRETLFPPILPRQPKAPKTDRRIDAASMGALQAAIESGL